MNERKLDNLISGLTGVNSPVRTAPVEQAGDAQNIEHKESDSGEDGQEERFCSILPSVLLRKVRIIARREGLSIKQVMAAAVMPSSLTRRTYSLILLDPSSNEYSVWTCKCAKDIKNLPVKRRYSHFTGRFLYAQRLILYAGMWQDLSLQSLPACFPGRPFVHWLWRRMCALKTAAGASSHEHSSSGKPESRALSGIR